MTQFMIADLMRRPAPARDLRWLHDALQAAIELELATLPPYLCGQWAQEQGSAPAQRIQGIAMDEMGHFGLVCNLLRGTGGKPQILAGYDKVVYPGPLPGGVRPKCDPDFFPCDPDFKVVLGFDDYKSFAKMCMQIEYPEQPVPRPRVFALEELETFPSIGEFYDAIQSALEALDGTFSYQTDKQLTNPSPAVSVIDGLAKATAAISGIKKQGEGASRYPFVDQAATRLAHFYTFGEIYFGREYVFDKVKQTGDWTGNPINVPDPLPMTPVPAGGYGAGAPPEVAECDRLFTQLLGQLDQAWATGNSNDLDSAIGSMFALESSGIELLGKRINRPGGGIYGPQFRKL